MKMDISFSNHSRNAKTLEIAGTNPVEVFILTLIVPIASLLLWILLAIIFNFSERFIAFIETPVINIILLLALTLLCDHLIPLLTILGVIFLILWLSTMRRRVTVPLMKCYSRRFMLELVTSKDFCWKFIGDYRGHLLLATSICILAVDFSIFPERFAKTETYGWSVMDAGVGSFVLIHGICSSYARESTLKQNNIKKGILSSIPLFIVGLARLALTSAVGYHKVVPEYGVHWNFFFTLAFTKVICCSILVIFPAMYSGLLAVLALISHQTLLLNGLSEFVLSETRENFVEANKEGICSLLGFVSIYFCGVQLGCYLWKMRFKIEEYIRLLMMLCVIGACSLILMYLFHENIQPVSRRMANLAYCTWVISLTSLQIAVHLAHQLFIRYNNILKPTSGDCLLWNAINYNGLFYFLMANVMTGLVNLSIDTGDSSEWVAFLILMSYLGILSISTVFMYKYSIHFKFW